MKVLCIVSEKMDYKKPDGDAHVFKRNSEAHVHW